jgi:hypothetical protein
LVLLPVFLRRCIKPEPMMARLVKSFSKPVGFAMGIKSREGSA